MTKQPCQQCGNPAELHRCWCLAMLCDGCRLGERHEGCMDSPPNLQTCDKPAGSGKELNFVLSKQRKSRVDVPIREFIDSIHEQFGD